MPEESPAETVLKKASTPEKQPETTPAAKPVVKDEKTLDIEICEAEDRLKTLRELKKTTKPAKTTPAPAAKSAGNWGTVLDEGL